MFSGGVLKDSGVLLPLKSEVIRFAAGFKSLDKNAVSWVKLSNEPLKTSNVIYINVVEFYNDEILRYTRIFESATQYFRDSYSVADS